MGHAPCSDVLEWLNFDRIDFDSYQRRKAMPKIGPDIYPLYVQKAFLLAGCDDCLQCCADDAVVLA
jgi:hypothetical protein